jgi:Uma2 family endonuclease
MATPFLATSAEIDAPVETPITAEELLAMGDIGPCELVRGEIVPHMPTGYPHGFIEFTLAGLLFVYLREHPIGQAMTGEVGILTARRPDTVRGADVAFISNERLSQAKPYGFLDVAPELVVEVMSPDDKWSEVNEKLAEYFAIGVLMVLVIDPHLEQIHVYRSLDDVVRLTREDEFTAEDILPSFRAPVSEIFPGKINR